MANMMRITPEMARDFADRGFWRGHTLGGIIERAAARVPDRTALIFKGTRITYRELKRLVDGLAVAFLELGIGSGQIISVQLPNCPEFIVALFAGAKAGAIVNPINAAFRSKEMAYILGFSRSVAVVVPDSFSGHDYPAMIAGIRPQLPALKHVITVGEMEVPGGVRYRDLVSAVQGEEPSRRLPRTDPCEHAALLYSSGTTAEPKGVLHPSNSIVYGGEQCGTLAEMGIYGEDRVLCLPSFANIFGLVSNIMATLFHQQTLLGCETFVAEEAVGLIERERVTVLQAVPAMIMALLRVPELVRRDLSSLRLIIYGGTVCPGPVVREAADRLGCRLQQTYGMSEAGPIAGMYVSDMSDAGAAVLGPAVPGMEMKVVDDQGMTLGPGEPGEIMIRGPALFDGYFGRPDATLEAFDRDGWLHTGDLGVLDAAGRLSVTGRLKDIINRGGTKISAKEIEDLLFQHPKIRDAAVVAMPDPRLGERACAFVVPEGGTQLTLEELLAFLKSKGIATFKLPEALHLVAELPYTPTGKVKRYLLREMASR